MNERIQALADQAEDYADSIVDQGGEFHPAYTKKFAELIVRECARVARATPCPYTNELMIQQLGHTWDMASSAAGREIIQHFGVEE